MQTALRSPWTWAAWLALAALTVAVHGTAGLGALLVPTLLGATQVSDITEQSTPDDHKVRDVSMVLSRLRPDRFSLDTIMRRMEQASVGMSDEPATAIKVEWEEDDTIEYQTSFDGAQTGGASPQTFTVNDTGVIQPNDRVYLPDNANDQGALLWVESVSGADITVYGVDSSADETSFTAVPDVADGETVIVLDRAKSEQDNASDPQGTMPEQLYNYTQIFDQVVSASETRLATENYTEEDWNRNRNQNLFELRRKLENAMAFGERMIVNDPSTGKQITMQNGITRYLSSNDLTYSAGSLDEATLIDFAQQIFSGNNGSQMRLWFCTPNQTSEIDKILISSGTLQSTREENILGVEATRLQTSFGELALINNQNFAELGKTNYGLVIDPANVRRRTLRPMTINRDVQSDDVDGRADQWLEESTVEVRKESTHAVVRDANTDSFE
jgi:hypothetical protein